MFEGLMEYASNLWRQTEHYLQTAPTWFILAMALILGLVTGYKLKRMADGHLKRRVLERLSNYKKSPNTFDALEPDPPPPPNITKIKNKTTRRKIKQAVK